MTWRHINDVNVLLDAERLFLRFLCSVLEIEVVPKVRIQFSVSYT
jgi:hypothetical protein